MEKRKFHNVMLPEITMPYPAWLKADRIDNDHIFIDMNHDVRPENGEVFMIPNTGIFEQIEVVEDRPSRGRIPAGSNVRFYRVRARQLHSGNFTFQNCAQGEILVSSELKMSA